MYKLKDDEAWPENGSFNYNAILQLDIFCKRQRKWTGVPYVQAFMALRENPELCKSYVREPCRLGPIQATQKPSLVAPLEERGPQTEDPNTFEGHIVCATHFISQSAPDIRRNLLKLAMGPQTSLNLIDKLSVSLTIETRLRRKRRNSVT